MDSIDERKEQADGEDSATGNEDGPDFAVVSPQKWARPPPLKVGSMRIPGPATLARQERWVHEGGEAFVHPLQTPAVSSVRAAQAQFRDSAVPPSPAAGVMREAQERHWVHHPPTTPAVQAVRQQQEKQFAGGPGSKQVQGVRTLQEDCFRGVNDLATLAMAASTTMLRTAATEPHPRPSPRHAAAAAHPQAAALPLLSLPLPAPSPGPSPAAPAPPLVSPEAAAPPPPDAQRSPLASAGPPPPLQHSLSLHTRMGAAVWGASADALHRELMGAAGSQAPGSTAAGRDAEADAPAGHEGCTPGPPPTPAGGALAALAATTASASLALARDPHAVKAAQLVFSPAPSAPLQAGSSGALQGLGPQAAAAILQQAVHAALVQRQQQEGWVKTPSITPSIQSIREDQEQLFCVPAKGPEVVAVQQKLAAFRSVPVSPAQQAIRQHMEGFKSPASSAAIQAFRKALDDPFADYKPPKPMMPAARILAKSTSMA